MDNKFTNPTEANTEDVTNTYEAITSQNQPLVQESNVLTYNDAGLLTMDPRSGGALSSLHLQEQPPPPPLPPPMSSNPHFARNCIGARGINGVFNGNKFEFVGAEFNSDAESRVTDWVNQHQKQHDGQNVVDRDSNQLESQARMGQTDHASLHDLSEDGNLNVRAEQVFENLQVDRHRLKLGCLLQEGTFGRVYQVRTFLLNIIRKLETISYNNNGSGMIFCNFVIFLTLGSFSILKNWMYRETK
jgi:hypothetical protein